MTAPITGMYCDRCGARHEFERARPSGVARLRELTRGVRGYVMNETPTFGDAMTDAWSRLEEDGALEQYAEVQKTFSFCLDCRGYVCHECWNAEAGRCLTCVPLPGTEAVAESIIAGRLDLVAGPRPQASPTLPAAPTEPAAPVESPATPVASRAIAPTPAAPAAPVELPDAGATALSAEGSDDVGSGSGGAALENVDATARLAWMGMAPDARPLGSPEASGTPADETATDVPEAGGAPTTPDVVDASPPERHAAREPAPHHADDDADVIAAAVAAGIILPPPRPRPEEPEPSAVPEPPTEPVTPAAGSSAAAAEVAETPHAQATPVPEAATQAGAILAEEAPPEPTATIPLAPAAEGPLERSAAQPSDPGTPVPAAWVPAASASVPVARAEPVDAAAASEAAAASARTRRGPDRRRAAPPPRRAPAPAHCRHCGLQVPAVARFCRRCGGRQTEDAPVQV
jgi:hypothetical protein